EVPRVDIRRPIGVRRLAGPTSVKVLYGTAAATHRRPTASSHFLTVSVLWVA
ncbi:MAG: hypothetical protein QOF44_2274, partial [Streptomyces sp.]|nr:hypothetical protein [Streptomyces sp.]